MNKRINHQNIFKKLIYATIFGVSLASCGGGGSSSTPTAVAPATAASATLGFDIKTFRFTWTDVSDATFYRLLENADGSSGFTQVGSDVAQGTQTADHIVPLYNRLNASYILQSCNVVGCTDGSAINITGALVAAIGYFKASNPTGDAIEFGGSVSLSDDGTTLAVGAQGESSSIGGINNTSPNRSAGFSGAVYVFTLNGNTWTEQAYIKANNPDILDSFGKSVSLSADGNTLAVGADRESSSTSGINTTPNNLLSTAGAVYVFERSNSVWSEQAYIKASNPGNADNFGVSVSLSSDGNTLAVGARGEDSSTTGINTVPNDLSTRSGATYVFSRTASTWSEQSYIKASNSSPTDSFGFTVSLSGDGSTLAVGSGDDSSTSGINPTPNNFAMNSGATYIYVLNGTTWSEQAFIKASNSDAGDTFGVAVSLSDDGNTLAVGAQFEDSSTTGINTTPDELASRSGAVYVFSRSGITWSEQAYIKASNADVDDEFGTSISLSNDGNTLAVGAFGEDSNTIGINTTSNDLTDESGAAYLYRRVSNTWSETNYIKASNTGESDAFASALSLSGDGNTLAVGAYQEDSGTTGISSTPDELGDESGAVYLY